MGPCCQFQRVTVLALVFLGIFMRPILTNNSTKYNSGSCHWEPWLGIGDGQLRYHIPCYYESSLRSHSEILGSFPCIRLPYNPLCPCPISTVSPCTTVFSSSHLPLHLIPPASIFTHSHLTHKIYSISHSPGDPCIPLESSLFA